MPIDSIARRLVTACWFLAGSALPVQAESDNRRIWTAFYENGQAALTEVWSEDAVGTERKLGAFPGRPGQLGWSADGRRLFYRDRPLRDYRLSGLGQAVAPMVERQVWEVMVNGTVVRRPGEVEFGRLDVEWVSACLRLPVRHRTQTGRARRGREAQNGGPGNGPNRSLSGVERAMMTVKLAYGSLHQWDFRQAQLLYRDAAQQFEAMARGRLLYSKPAMAYAKLLAHRSRMASSEGARWVGRENLSAIGEMIREYRRLHNGNSPVNLEVLMASARAGGLDEAEERILKRMFRSPEDQKQRPISYFYRSVAADGEAMVISPYHRGRLLELVRQGDGFKVVDRAAGEAQVDSLLAVGSRALEKDASAAVPVLQVVTLMAPGSARGHSRLGYAYLKSKNPDAALRSFERAVRLDHRLAEAYNGLGQVFETRPKARYDAIRYYTKALQYNRDYLEARFNIARLRRSLQEHDAKYDIEKVIDIDPTYAPAYLLLGEWYEVHEEDFERAALLYARYMTLKPDDPEGRKRLAAVYLRSRNYERIVDLLTDYVREHPDETGVMAVLAQACVQLGRLEWADRYFREYLQAATPYEQALYRDPVLLMSSEEREAYERAEGSDRVERVKRFWSAHDPDLTTAINERLLEHYRRVWYALGAYSKGKQPWDRRGEVYIRFGEPDYRSTSNMKNYNQSLKVQRVRERIARQMYGQAALQMTFMGGPVYAVRSLKSNLSGGANLGDGFAADRRVVDLSIAARNTEASRVASGGEAQRTGVAFESGVTANNELTGESLELLRFENVQMNHGALALADSPNDFAFKAVTSQDDASMVPWEVWVYTGVNGGIEITFTDEHMRGEFDYAPPPMDVRIPMQQLARFNQFNPRSVAKQAALVTPDYYKPPENKLPLEFYYDLANFREDERGAGSILEVYFGAPYKLGKYSRDDDETEMFLERSVALNNPRTGAVYRRQGNLVYRGGGDLTGMRGGFVPDLVGLDVPPGTYRMEVQVKDRLSGRQGRYRQEVVIDNYDREFLQLSELQLAYTVAESDEAGKFRKGGLRVIPIPTRTFGREQGVFVYYEIYRLKKDEFGQTRYKVEYSIRPRGVQGRKARGVVSQLVRVLTGKKQELAVGYEQIGNSESEEVYMELDLKSTKPGHYILEIDVTDLNSGLTSSRETGFYVQ